jgi:hypothetical protein
LSNPLKEASRHNSVLEEWLRGKGFPSLKVKGAVFMAGDATVSEIVDPLVYVITNPGSLAKYIEGLWVDPQFTPEFCGRITKLLEA